MSHHRMAPLIALLMMVLVPVATLGAASLSVEADLLEFSTDGQSVRAEGHAILVYEDIELRAASLTVEGQIVKARGQVRLTSAQGVLSADLIELNLQTREIFAEGIRGRIGDFYVRGTSIAPGAPGQDQQVLMDAGVTRCDRDIPCYELQAGRITITGRKVTVARGWLAIKGLRVLPLPRVTLDLDRTGEWPRLYGGYGPDGLHVGASVTSPISDSAGLILAGEVAVDDPLSVRAALAWQASQNALVEPWLEYSSADGYGAGLDTTFKLGDLTVKLSASKEWSTPLVAARLSASSPLLNSAKD